MIMIIFFSIVVLSCVVYGLINAPITTIGFLFLCAVLYVLAITGFSETLFGPIIATMTMVFVITAGVYEFIYKVW